MAISGQSLNGKPKRGASRLQASAQRMENGKIFIVPQIKPAESFWDDYCLFSVIGKPQILTIQKGNSINLESAP